MFEQGEDVLTRGIVVLNVDVFMKMAAHWNCAVTQFPDGIRYNFHMPTGYLTREFGMVWHPSWWDEAFFQSVYDDKIDEYIFWCDDDSVLEYDIDLTRMEVLF